MTDSRSGKIQHTNWHTHITMGARRGWGGGRKLAFAPPPPMENQTNDFLSYFFPLVVLFWLSRGSFMGECPCTLHNIIILSRLQIDKITVIIPKHIYAPISVIMC